MKGSHGQGKDKGKQALIGARRASSLCGVRESKVGTRSARAREGTQSGGTTHRKGRHTKRREGNLGVHVRPDPEVWGHKTHFAMICQKVHFSTRNVVDIT